MNQSNLYELLAEHIQEGVYVVDRERRITEWNAAAERITGYLRAEVLGQPCQKDLLLHCAPSGEVLCGDGCPLVASMVTGHERSAKVFFRHKDGHRSPVTVRAAPVRDEHGQVSHVMEVFSQEDAGASPPLPNLLDNGCVDEGTGLLGRRYVEWRAAQRLAEVEAFGGGFGWISIELDDVAALEQRYGQPAIDAMVDLVARTLSANAKNMDLLSRWGPAEFRVATHGLAADGVREFSSTLTALIRASDLMWWGDLLSGRASVGATMAIGGDTVQTLDTRAVMACRTSRSRGGNCSCML